MTTAQERAITYALNILHVGFFECTRQYFQYFINNDEWALLMTASGLNDVNAEPMAIALAVLARAVAKEGYFAEMKPFAAPAHFCSFLQSQNRTGERSISLQPCSPDQRECPYATFEHLYDSKCGTKGPCARKMAKMNPATQPPEPEKECCHAR